MIERRRVMATNNPPYDAEIEYLEGTGTQYIETGIIPNADTGIYINAYSSNNIDSYVVGLRNTTGDTRWCIGHSNGYYYGYNNYNNSRIGANPTELWLNYNNDGLFRSISNSYSLPTLSFTPAYNIRLFGSAGIVASYTSWKGKLYNVKITQGNNLIMDLIPVRKDTTGYMYDKVSGRLFGNSGTGDFILGEDIIPIEYLKSTGTQWIQTDYYPDSSVTDMTLDIEFYGTWNNSSGSIVCAHDSDSPWLAYGFNFPGSGNNSTTQIFAWTGYMYRHGGSTKSISGISKDRGEFKYSNGVFSYGGKTLNTEVVAGRRMNALRIFSSVGNETAVFKAFNANLYGLYIKENNELIRDYIPVRIGQVGYLYDKVSNRLFGNSGTSDFVLGPDKEGGIL